MGGALHSIDSSLDRKHHRFIHRNDRDELGYYLFPRWKRWWWWLDWKAEAGGFVCKLTLACAASALCTLLGVLVIFIFCWLCVDLVSGEQIWQFILSDILLIVSS